MNLIEDVSFTVCRLISVNLKRNRCFFDNTSLFSI